MKKEGPIDIRKNPSPVFNKEGGDGGGDLMSELQNVLAKRSNPAKIAPPGGNGLSFRNQWESKDTNVRSEQYQSVLPTYGNLDPYAPIGKIVEAKNEELNKKNLELINQITQMKNSSETQRAFSFSTPSSVNGSAAATSVRSVNENTPYDKYAAITHYRNLEHDFNLSTISNSGNYSNTLSNYGPPSSNTAASASYNTAYSASVHNNIDAAGAYGGHSSTYANTEDHLVDKIGQIWLSSHGLSKDTIKKHNELVAESKRKARNLYDPVEANYQRINYAPTNLQVICSVLIISN